jgi:hypothetical protein
VEQRIVALAKRASWLPIPLAIILASPAVAGVVIVQKTTAGDGTGGTKVTTSTTMIEGSKQRTTSDTGAMIVDLDKGTMVNLYPASKTATEMSLKQKEGPGAMMTGGMLSNFNLSFTPTGAHKKVAGYSCDEYTGKGKMMVDFTMTSCFSKDAPGTTEYEKFTKRMMDTLGAKGAATMPAGIVLFTEMVMQPIMSAEAVAKMADSLPPDAVKQMAEAAKPQRSVSEVTSVKVESLSADIFAVPADYKTQSIDRGTKGK